MRDKAEQNLQIARKEKNEEQRVRLWLNQISPDNYEKKQSELRGLLFGDLKAPSEPMSEEDQKNFKLDEDKMNLVVQTIFRKAQMEHSYANFYAVLVADIIGIELQLKGLGASSKNRQLSSFRQMLLDHCKNSFDLFFKDSTFLTKEGEEMSSEEVFKKKHKLFGNIDFVGELYKKGIISDGIIKSVFVCLLGIKDDTISQENNEINDDTIEAGIALMNKLGADLTQKANRLDKMKVALD